MAESSTSKSLTVEAYAAAVASGSPTPGGGSVSAMVASFAAALAEMVCNLTLAGKSSPKNTAALQRASAEAARLRAELLDLATADESAYAGYRTAAALPKDTEVEKHHRRAEIDRALKRAADVPLLIARTATDVLSVLEVVAEHGTRHALSDASTGALLAGAATRSALFNVRVNADLMRDEEAANTYRSESEILEKSAREQALRVIASVAERG